MTTDKPTDGSADPHQPPRRRRERLTSSWLGRATLSAGALGRVAASAATGTVRRILSDKAGADRSRLDDFRDMAQRLYETFGDLKGPMMKVMQMVSYVDLALPPEAQELLAKLQDQAPPMSAAAVERVFVSELGKPPTEIFQTWSSEPVAAASIGQVHRATLRDGRSVAVKVQYPGIADAFKADLRSATLLRTLGGVVMRNLDAATVVDELKQVLMRECDYRLEANNQRRFRELYANDPDIFIPAVVDELSTERVLTTEFVDGSRFQAFSEQATQEQKNHAGQVISRFAFESIFDHLVFNCDPHPGNYLFLRDGRVAFLDFGCVKTFTPEFVALWKSLIHSVLGKNHTQFRDTVIRLGLVPRPEKFDFDYHFKAMLYLYRPWLRDAPFRYTREYAAESMRVLLSDNPNQLETNMPRDFVFVNRLQWGLNSVLARLHAEANWRASFLPLVYDDPAAWPAPYPAEPTSFEG